MQNFYITFSLDGQPFGGGWIIIKAHTEKEANIIFRNRWPDKHPGTYNYAGIYTEKEFEKTGMRENGNLGAFCHMVI